MTRSLLCYKKLRQPKRLKDKLNTTEGNMTTLAVIGSCMSNLTAARLVSVFGFDQTHCVHHNRSDTFLKYYVDRTFDMIPKYRFDSLIMKPGYGENERAILDNQYLDSLGFFQLENRKRTGKTFLDDLREIKIDLILLDNFMDVASMLMCDTSDQAFAERPLFINIGFYEQEHELAEKFSFTPFLSPLESAHNWLRIYHWLRKLQPDAKIVFLPYHTCSSLTDRSRYERVIGFSSIFARLATAENLIVIPPLELASEMTKGEQDWPHFQDNVYLGLAGQVYLKYINQDKIIGLPL